MLCEVHAQKLPMAVFNDTTLVLFSDWPITFEQFLDPQCPFNNLPGPDNSILVKHLKTSGKCGDEPTAVSASRSQRFSPTICVKLVDESTQFGRICENVVVGS